MLSKAHWTSHSRMSGSRSVITPSWLSGSWRSFLYSSSVYSCHLFLISSAEKLYLFCGYSFFKICFSALSFQCDYMWAFLLHLMRVVGWKLAPKKIHPCQSLEHLDLLEKRIFAYAVKLFWDEKVIYTGPKCHHKFPHKKRQRQMWHKQSRTHCDYRGKGWSDISTSQSCQRLEDGRNRFFSEFSEAVQPCNSLSSDLRRNDKPRRCIKKQRHYFIDKGP